MSIAVEKVTLTTTNHVVVEQPVGSVVVTGVLTPLQLSTVTNSVDVDLTDLTNGATLIYSDLTQKWRATKLLENQTIECGQF